MFPITSKVFKEKALTAGLHSARNNVLVDTTKIIVNDMNKTYTKIFGRTFEEAQAIVNDTLKANKVNERKSQIEYQAKRKMKKDMEAQFKGTVER